MAWAAAPPDAHVNPAESHAWFQAASARERSQVIIECAAVEHLWTRRLDELRQERDDIRSLARGGRYRPEGLIEAAVRASVEFAIILAVFPDEPRHVLRASWE